MRRASSTASGAGVNTALATGTWSGWMHIFPWKPRRFASSADLRKPSASSSLVPDRIEGRFQTRGARGQHAGIAIGQQFVLITRPFHCHVECKVTGAECEPLDPGSCARDCIDICNATTRLKYWNEVYAAQTAGRVRVPVRPLASRPFAVSVRLQPSARQRRRSPVQTTACKVAKTIFGRDSVHADIAQTPPRRPAKLQR